MQLVGGSNTRVHEEFQFSQQRLTLTEASCCAVTRYTCAVSTNMQHSLAQRGFPSAVKND
jgi:hypothetical protein